MKASSRAKPRDRYTHEAVEVLRLRHRNIGDACAQDDASNKVLALM
jgi:hypothetical protein